MEPAAVDEWSGTFSSISCAKRMLSKAEEVSARYPEAVVLGADTLVGLGGEVMEACQSGGGGVHAREVVRADA